MNLPPHNRHAELMPYDQQRVYNRGGEYLGFNAKQLLTTNIRMPGAPGSEANMFVQGRPTVFQLAAQDTAGESTTVVAGALICNDMWAYPGCSIYDPMLTHVLYAAETPCPAICCIQAKSNAKALSACAGLGSYQRRWCFTRSTAARVGRTSTCPFSMGDTNTITH